MRLVPMGEYYEPYMDANDYYSDNSVACECCGDTIPDGENAYYVSSNYYCRHCEDAARDEIFDAERDNYLVEVNY